ncbi:hypothetical protein H634G_09729 [Metarhizium anisopliae BRIP 53293]|uniref:ABC transporter n=1 Tax=Metarhizium anisopliae BRIP 53293 TaxID=1291518 RepID=A0A0D9NME1_METAN|nr:hypothetical protein H634G_09729 [Metarhizium anisopliae BRIP 53293]KJK86490.1 hypothetical protein H633G_09664 [Metarhizium anisopliae BRIP 53284]
MASILAVAMVVYVGEAICIAVYQHQQNRLRVMMRGALVGLVFNKTLQSQSNNHDRGKSVTLMNTDVDSLSGIGRMAHDIWAYFLELAIGMVILTSQVGWLSPVPLVIIVFCSRVSKYVAQHIHGRQKEWNAATQNRLSMITAFLGSIKTIKLLGISGSIAEYVASLRSTEIERAKSVRWIMVGYNASANFLGIFTPAITMILYRVLSQSHHSTIDAETAFTTIAVLSMVIHPANMIMTIIPRVVATFASFERLQNYLLEAPRQDQRVVLEDKPERLLPHGNTAAAISLEEVTVEADKTSAPALDRVTLEVERSSLVICAGPTGAGKTVLAKAILGEVAISHGTVKTASRRIGYCDQTPWLPNGSIRDVIYLNQLPMGDSTEIGSRGLNLSGGQKQRMALARMLYDECDIVILDDPFSSLDGRTEDQVINNLFGPEGIFHTRRSTVFWITNATNHFKLADSVVILENSRIKEHGHWSVLDSLPDASGKVMSDDSHEPGQVDAETSQLDAQKKKAKELDTRLDLNRKTGNLSLYGYYFKSAGLFNAIFMIGCTATYSFFITFPHYWLKRWTEADQNVEWLYMMVYGLLALFAWVATNGTMWSTFMLVTPRSGLFLHSKAPLSFFATTDIGVILNRFSQDIQLVDRDLPGAFQSLSNQIFKLLVQVSLLLAVQKLLLLTIPLCFVVICLVARVYFRTSRQVRIEELASRSAVFSQIVETVEGLITIRAFRWQSRCQSHFDRALDGSQGPLYLLSSLQRWLNLVLDLMVAAISVTIIALALFLRSTTTGAAVGVALNIILVTNTTIVRLVESWADFEVSLGAIERLKTLDEGIRKEDRPGEDNIPETSWPQRGGIVIDHVTAAYNGRSASLRNISLTIKAGQKVVVGKSTLLLSLLRLVEITGDISVDGVDLSRISRAAIREQCFITVPQDPMLLPDTPLRFSLDPSGKAEISQIVDALQKTGVWSLLCESNTANVAEVLDRKMSELPALSVGQLQLLGIARALVKKAVLGTKLKPVLLLDEATSSLDTATESLIHNLIDEEFSGQGYTVVAVAHRLGVVTGRMRPMDMVVMMADGAIRKVGGAEEVLGSDLVSSWTS